MWVCLDMPSEYYHRLAYVKKYHVSHEMMGISVHFGLHSVHGVYMYARVGMSSICACSQASSLGMCSSLGMYV
jgi:hypothetical protein